MKKFVLFSVVFLSLILVSILFAIFSFSLLFSQDSGVKEFEENFNIRLPRGTVSEKIYDDYSGFHNDGVKLYKFVFTPKGMKSFVSYIEKQKDWEKLPLSQSYQALIYGGEVKDFSGNVTGFGGFAKEVGLPKISSGYWKAIGDKSVITARFIDYENLDIKTLINLNSYDFYLAIYDTKKGILYMFHINT
ncbi:hypothetical protein Calkro_2163 [Caldicellulosiruptor kronotskyensis 2002]|uniref:Uncharacterized protein n=1 Tax=Caldicellulosiruptor kronotskyensis (strain DSM 18902 / VKM B-2412 / 2002) TaxID=632348 RepID=E4SGX6_CALK2|nr:hypothetical protein [Caldicellulosiruptor kronotskyensis]ADQ47001.1 hypothetical protein Calkro_2163 [Caldicellulosiruptor kronotskyensis 2002]